MSFRDDFPDYEKYQNGEFYYNEVPAGIVSALKGLILRIAEDPQQLKSICNDVASRIPCEPTQNWGWDWLVSDLDQLLDRLSQKKMHKLMDFVYDLVKHHDSRSLLEELNEMFDEYDFGYRLTHYQSSPMGVALYWELYQKPDTSDEIISRAQNDVKDICTQAKEHLEQARYQIQNTDNPRARKDALRDCLSAMEAMVNQMGGNSDISKSIKTLREDGRWGSDLIIKDGLGIWNRLHDLYPDIRHGNHNISDISKEEALYWIERLMVYVSYIARRKKAIFSS